MMLKPLLSFTLLLLVMTGCGYKPSAHFAHDVMGDKVSTQVIISLQDPQNTVVMKDALDSAIITRFKSSLTDRAHSQTHLEIRLKEISFSALQYDSDGYIVSYRTRILLDILRSREGFVKRYQARGTYDFRIEPNAIISDQARYDAIKFSAQKAIDSFVAQVAAEGVRRNGKE